ncbi:porin [Stenotrophomonas sp. MMGLT7]|uniref:OprO/OprP family phosphate-selective porin n=1 Tax=Stenotrophomonas sp. MMGLT7 TaxID=2901227 RepID=UPI001E3C1773|nr:porin [Stenotrophomonas sp. MMGLT7]MCD7099608.1 porin [Stenotrophomonas sp. MMGLT7]
MKYKGNLGRLAAACALALGSAQPGAWAQSMSTAGLETLVAEQARRIEQLERRLTELERREPAAAAEDLAAAPARPAGSDTALARRIDDLEKRQAGQPEVSFSKGAPQFTSSDGEWSFRPRGRIQLDASSTSGSRFDDRNLSGTEGRSVRLGVEGRYGRAEYAVEGEFADGSVVWKSAYMTVPHTLLGQEAELTVGQRLNDRGMEGSSGSPQVPFQERNVVAAVTQPVRGYFGLGLTERVFGDGWHVSASATGDGLGSSGADDDSLVWAVRAHWNPYRSGGLVAHLGGWGFYEHLAQDASGVVGSFPVGSHFNDQLRISAGDYGRLDRTVGYGLEAGAIAGPAWAFAEWGRREIEGPGTGAGIDAGIDAYTVSAGWFVSGGSPAYSTRTGTWSRPDVRAAVGKGGAGAWELRARYESVDYAELPGGGRGHAATAGVNWYLNPLLRLMFDMVRWHADNPAGTYAGADDGYTYNTRLQLVF